MPEGESYRQMLKRASTELDDILERYAGTRIVIFSHTGTICLLVLHLLGALETAAPRPVWIATRNCGIAHFEFRPNSIPRLHAVNDTRHLEILHK
jgi:broad specificity phosphatase PhoE